LFQSRELGTLNIPLASLSLSLFLSFALTLLYMMSQDAIDPSLLSFVSSNQFTASSEFLERFFIQPALITPRAVDTRPRPLAPDSISNQGQASLGGGAQASETKEERRRYTPEEDAKLCQLKQEGKGRQHIAKLLGRSINSISHRSTVLRDKGEPFLEGDFVSRDQRSRD